MKASPVTSTIVAILALAVAGTAWAQTMPSIQPSIQPGLPDAGASTRSPAPGLDEGAAKSKLESEGYRDVRGMTSNPDGSWNGKAVRDNSQLDVVIDSGGNIKTR